MKRVLDKRLQKEGCKRFISNRVVQGIDSMKNTNGFTLIEVLVAIVVLGLGIGALWIMQVGAIDANTKSNFDTVALFQGSEQLESWIISTYDHMDLRDTDGDGTGQDSDGNGVDDAGNQFGLDDYPGCRQVSASLLPGCNGGNQTADGTATLGEGDITIFWNVAMDYPVEYTKTIRVHILRPSGIRQKAGNAPMIIEYVKEEGI